MARLRGAIAQPGVGLLLGAGLISLTGDWVLRVGLSYYVYALTGSTLASAGMLLASFIPQIALSSLAAEEPTAHLALSNTIRPGLIGLSRQTSGFTSAAKRWRKRSRKAWGWV